MKTKVLEALKPKAASFGFNEEELASASENIAGTLSEEATAEEIANAVDAALPYLKLSQSAANRSFERFKKQFEEEHPTKTKEQEEAERKAKEEAERKAKEEEEAKKKAQKEEPDWFKQYRKDNDAKIKALEDENARLSAEKANAEFTKKAKDALVDVDESYYALLLKSKTFKSQDEVDAFVNEVKEGWEAMSKKLKIGSLSHVRPPKGGSSLADKPSAEVQARIDRRKKAQTTASPLRGLDTNK